MSDQNVSQKNEVVSLYDWAERSVLKRWKENLIDQHETACENITFYDRWLGDAMPSLFDTVEEVCPTVGCTPLGMRIYSSDGQMFRIDFFDFFDHITFRSSGPTRYEELDPDQDSPGPTFASLTTRPPKMDEKIELDPMEIIFHDELYDLLLNYIKGVRPDLDTAPTLTCIASFLLARLSSMPGFVVREAIVNEDKKFRVTIVGDGTIFEFMLDYPIICDRTDQYRQRAEEFNRTHAASSDGS